MYRRDCGNRRESKKAAALRLKVFLSSVDAGRTISKYRIKLSSFRDMQRIPSLMQDGKVTVTVVVSERGKEAVVAMHGKGDFVGEGCLTGQPRRLATVRAMTESVIMRFTVVRRAPRRAYLPKRPRGAPHRTLPSARVTNYQWTWRSRSNKRPGAICSGATCRQHRRMIGMSA